MKLVEVDWVDSVRLDGWRDNAPVGNMKVKSFGLVIAEEKESITITTSIFEKMCMSPLQIPRKAITKIRVIRNVKT